MHKLLNFLKSKRPKKTPVMRIVDDGIPTYDLAKMGLEKKEKEKKK